MKVSKGDEVGVCRVCGMGGEELYWGCGGCFEREEARRRREYWEDLGLGGVARTDDGGGERDEGEGEEGEGETEGREGLTKGDKAAKWLIEKTEEWRGKREKKRRRKMARRREGGGRWWRRVVRGSVSWEGSWEGRVEALVEYLNGKDVKGIEEKKDADEIEESMATATTGDEWKALDQVPLKRDRREARCNSCWMPTCFRKTTYMLGMAYEKDLPFERWCEECKMEQREKAAKRKKRRKKRGVGVGDGGGNEGGEDVDVDEALEALRLLFV